MVVSPGFSCQAAGCALEIRHWTGLWTTEHLQKRLLEPLGGIRLVVAPDLSLATLHFDSERTAARAELICRAAAAAAENNLRIQAAAAAAAASATPSRAPSGEPQMKLEIPPRGSLLGSSPSSSPALMSGLSSGGAVASGSSGSGPSSTSAMSPVFKSAMTPPTSYTSYLFDTSGHFDAAAAAAGGPGGGGVLDSKSGVGPMSALVATSTQFHFDHDGMDQAMTSHHEAMTLAGENFCDVRITAFSEFSV